MVCRESSAEILVGTWLNDSWGTGGLAELDFMGFLHRDTMAISAVNEIIMVTVFLYVATCYRSFSTTQQGRKECHWRNWSRKGRLPENIFVLKFGREQTGSVLKLHHKQDLSKHDTAGVGIKKISADTGPKPKRSKIVLQISLITLHQPKTIKNPLAHWYLGSTLVGNSSLTTVISRQANRLVLWKLREKVHCHLPNLIRDTPSQRNDAQGWVTIKLLKMVGYHK